MNDLLLFDFSATENWDAWEIENDVVMGGNSSSRLERGPDGNAVFLGNVSLENNGGFASMQYHFEPKDITGYKVAVIHVKGDGKEYQFRIKADLDQRASYIYTFKTTGDLQTIEIPLKQMQPTYRANKLQLPNFNANTLQEVRFFIGNGKAENFKLEIQKIELRR